MHDAISSHDPRVAVVFDLARTGQTEALAELLDAGLPADLHDPKGDSLLLLASYYGHAETVARLLRAGAHPNAVGARGQTPLAGAAFKGNLDVLRALVDGGAAVNFSMQGGKTALHFAAMFDRAEAVRFLVEQGAQDLPDHEGIHALDLARAYGAGRGVAELERLSSIGPQQQTK
jgi:hypothetical protein